MRLGVVLSKAGIASRRKSAYIIKEGRVKVNGKVITQPGFNVDVSKDDVRYCGKKVCIDTTKIYFLLNKPKGTLTTVSDPYKRKTVLEYIPDTPYRLYPVGRLDKDTSGLLIITNDGELAYRLTHPRFRVDRVYEVVVKGRLKEKEKVRLQKGIYLDGKKTTPCRIEILKSTAEKTFLRITLYEGRKRQIRNMFKKVGYPVVALRRIKFGPIRLGSLKEGESRLLNKDEIKLLQNFSIFGK